MASDGREVVITGIGLVSCLGEGPDAHWNGLSAGSVVVDESTFAPYPVHPLAPIELDRQIPKKGDQRQMEPWQRIGTYAAGLALDSAGAKGNVELLERMDMIVAAGGGERDLTVDETILAGLRTAEDADTFLNTRLMTDLRPTLMLAQLANLLAGNISIVHGVIGSSRTFMGEEAAGTDALRIALARTEARQSDIALVGSAFNAERKDSLIQYDFGSYLKGAYRPVWQRGPQGGLVIGSVGAFLVLEARAHADNRGATPIARLTAVLSRRTPRRSGDVAASLAASWQELAGRLVPDGVAVISGATGIEPATAEERAFLAAHPQIPVRATGSYLGHGLEAQVIMNVALAALAVNRGRLFAPGDPSMERPMPGALRQVAVTAVGHWRGEGLALVDAA
jgi:3-oxoacyl-[acyl-carrier-protein] synthase II